MFICNFSLLHIIFKVCDGEELDLEPGETVDSSIMSCLAVLKQPAKTEKDRCYL